MQKRALSLSAYMAWARGAMAGDGFAEDLPERPPGPLIWAHAGGRNRGRALASLCARLCLQRPEVTVVVSGDMPERDGQLPVRLPQDAPTQASTLMRHMRPDVVLWAGQRLRPALLQAARAEGARLIALDASDAMWDSPAPRWLPDPAPATLGLFHRLHANTEAAARRLRRLNVPNGAIRVSGPLTDAAVPLDCEPDLHKEISELLTGRPVWLAAHLRASEAGEILRAHRRAMRLAHRLMLIAVPATDVDFAAIATAIEAEQMRACAWDNGDMPDENTQVLVTEGPEELGLWYRLAPLTFLGGSLVPGVGGTNPFEAAALGTAILYGPNVGRHLAGYSRLVEAGAARIVRDTDSLASAVSHLIAPDQAASMAHAGWDVISSGAALVDEVIAEVTDLLDGDDMTGDG